MAQPRMVYDDAMGEMVPMTRRTANGAIETMMSDGSWQITSAAPGPTTWTPEMFSQFWNNPDEGGRFAPNVGDIFPITTPDDLVKWGFGNQSPDATKGLTEYMPGANLADFQAQTNSLPFRFTEQGAVYDPAARANPMNYEGTPDWREMVWPAAFTALAGAGLGGMLPGTENVFAGLGSGAAGGTGATAATAGEAAGATGAAAGGAGSSLSGLADFSLAAPGTGIGGVGTAGLGLGSAGSSIGLTPALQAAGGTLASGGLIGATADALAAAGGVGALNSAIPSAGTALAGSAAGIPSLTSATGGGAAGGAAAKAATSSLLSRVMSGEATTDDWLNLTGQALGGLSGYFGSKEVSDAYKDLNTQLSGQRAPFLNKAVGYVNDPQSFYTSPEATGAADASMRALSTKFGNPGTSPTAQSLATGALYDRYLNSVNTLGSLGLGGQGIQANLGSQVATSAGQPYAIAGNLIGGLTSPTMNVDQLLQQSIKKLFGGNSFGLA